MNLEAEHQLIIACKQGKTWAQKKVYERYAPKMMALCMRYLSDKDAANDVLQEGFIKVFTHIRQYSGEGEFGGWIRKIFVNVALMYLRNNKKIMTWENEQLLDDSENMHTAWNDKISVDDLMECIEELPTHYRTIFNLFAIEGYAHQEIAEMLQISTGTSRAQFYRARLLLQAKVKKLLNE